MRDPVRWRANVVEPVEVGEPVTVEVSMRDGSLTIRPTRPDDFAEPAGG